MKKNSIILLESIYNCMIGFWTPILITLIGMFLTNHPKGDGYFVPEEEAGFNVILGLMLLSVYVILAIVMNIVFYRNKEKEERWIIKGIPILWNGIGIISFCIFNILKMGGKL